jgi:hypothetical protein
LEKLIAPQNKSKTITTPEAQPEPEPKLALEKELEPDIATDSDQKNSSMDDAPHP